MATPKNLSELFNKIVNAAASFGFKDEDNGILRDCIHKDKNNISAGFTTVQGNDDNFWFGFIRENQLKNDVYEGLSFVIFPERDNFSNVSMGSVVNNDQTNSETNVSKEDGVEDGENDMADDEKEMTDYEDEMADDEDEDFVYDEDEKEDAKNDEKGLEELGPKIVRGKSHYCVAAICFGSGTLGADSELASSHMFRRSFCSLTKRVSLTSLFFKYKFDEIGQPTPRLQEYIDNNNFENAMRATTTKYNTGEHPGLLPAAMVVDYTKVDGFNLIISWLAQYAKWRNWERYKNGSFKTGVIDKIQKAINKGRVNAKCPTPKNICQLLFKRRFIVLQGAPGCGKTWTAKKVAMLKYKNGSNVFEKTKFIQFHAETTYADFVYGIKPNLNGTTLAYEGNKGALLEIMDSAIKEPDKKFLLIIDEFNRANLANVLGPVFYLFEQDSGGNNLELKLGKWLDPDEKDEKEKLKELVYKYIPDNLYVIATMNTADKSLAVVDFALRRRFSWVTLRPHKLNTNLYPKFDKELFDKVEELFMKYATDEELNLQPGQSYFMDKNKKEDSIKYGLMPLMKEYFNGGYLLPAKDEFMQLFYTETGIFMYE